ncbi:Gfo/Idh/MocA family protein [Acidaminococcus timonensis]|uniref:Gfo/Idh/MocA family protein n=1 Tax=Acidaminococcus timonensis TaxID=1871002 RepID=UPI0025FC665E|nr:Gfo/Idh/MocA family oxidoreductase [Acidaminococcus timonensis]
MGMKLGFMGSGAIMPVALAAVSQVPSWEKTAIWVRPHSAGRGQALAEKYGIQKVYTDLDTFLEDPEIETVYIALINPVHAFYARKALLHGKNVLLEKPFTTSYAEAQELAALARVKRLYLLETMPLWHCPIFARVQELVPTLGKLRLIQCNYSQYSSRYDAYRKGEVLPAFDPALYGGALYDLNVYNLDFALALLGRPEAASYHANRGWNGVDTSGVLVLDYPGCRAELTAAKDSDSPSFLLVQGEKGWLRVEGKPIHMASVTWQYTQGPDKDQFTTGKADEKGPELHTAHAPKETNRMVPEFREYARIIGGEWSGEAQECLEWSLEEARILETVAGDSFRPSARDQRPET